MYQKNLFLGPITTFLVIQNYTLIFLLELISKIYERSLTLSSKNLSEQNWMNQSFFFSSHFDVVKHKRERNLVPYWRLSLPSFSFSFILFETRFRFFSRDKHTQYCKVVLEYHGEEYFLLFVCVFPFLTFFFLEATRILTNWDLSTPWVIISR